MWTIGPYLRHLMQPLPPPPSRHWESWARDPVLGPIRLTGRLRDPADADELVVLVHGLGGSATSHYIIDAARAVDRAGLASLRLNLRGADRRGEDYYHAGLTADLRAMLHSPELARYTGIYLLGYSMGGHVALRYLAEGPDSRIRATAAICPPLDLARSARYMDEPPRAFYRRHVLQGLKEMYRAVAQRRQVPLDVERAMAIDTFRAWDDRVVAPRHGFRDAEDYWARTSAGPHLVDIDVPSLVVAVSQDPMVPDDVVRPVLERPATAIHRVWLDRGGHVGFPRDADLGLGHQGDVLDQVLAWLRAR